MGTRQKVSDQQISQVITALFGAGDATWPSVIEVATRLRRDYGHQGTHDRIRRALAAAKARPTGTDTERGETGWRERALQLQAERSQDAERIETLEVELKRAIERAELAEAREDESSRRWLMEVDQARTHAREMDAQRPKGVDPDSYLDLYRRLQAALTELQATREALAACRGERGTNTTIIPADS